MSDKNLHSFYETDSNSAVVMEQAGIPTPKPDWSDTIKITSGCHGLWVNIGTIWGGREDCVDINNGANGIGVNANFIPQGKYVATIKGGTRDITLAGSISLPGGSEVDIDLGNWSDQSSRKVTGVALNLAKPNRAPVTVRVLNADKPAIIGGGPYEYAFPHPDAWYHGIIVKAMLLLGKLGLLKYL